MNCNKAAYASERFAEQHVKIISDKSEREKIPVRPYLCTKCGLWHLTSRDNFKDKEIKELKDKISILQKENVDLKNIENRELKLSVKALEKVIELEKAKSTLSTHINNLRKQISELVTKNIQLQQKLDKYESVQTKT